MVRDFRPITCDLDRCVLVSFSRCGVIFAGSGAPKTPRGPIALDVIFGEVGLSAIGLAVHLKSPSSNQPLLLTNDLSEPVVPYP
jgi:hypothetical protein